MKTLGRNGAAGIALILIVCVLTALFVRSPRISSEATLRYASAQQQEADDDMAELLMLLNGE